MAEIPSGHTVMKSLGIVVLLVAAAAAAAVPAETPAGGDKINFRCAVNKEFKVVVKEVKTPFYLCSSEEGDHFLMAASIDGLENTFETSLPKAETTKLKELNALIVGSAPARPKRSPQFGQFGGSGASANANAFSGGGNVGYGPGGFGPSFGGGGSGASANAGSYSGGFNQQYYPGFG